MNFEIRTAFLLLCVFIPSPAPASAQQDSGVARVMAGLSNQGRNATDPYVAAGDRAYLIGTQDGNFPDLGGHVPGEMGGLWVHPIKLIDGFQATVSENTGATPVPLSQSTEFINYPYGNRLKYGEVLRDIQIDRFQFSPDGYPGVIVQYTFRNTGSRQRTLGLELTVRTDLLPVWFSDQLGIKDARDTVVWQAKTRRYLARDTRHPWFAVWGATGPGESEPVIGPESSEAKGNGVTAGSRHSILVQPHDSSTLTFVFTGSSTSRGAADSTFAYLARHVPDLLQRKKSHYAALIDRASIRIPDERLQQVYDWVKIDAEWLVREVPGIGRGLSAGLMEYPWWFGTETYSLQALLATGHPDLAKQTLRLLRKVSDKRNGNGRIVHEVTTNGGISNPGNTQETALFIVTIRDVVRWTGDLAFAREMYPAMKQGLHWLLTDQDQNHNLFPEGYGITEILDLNSEVIDVATTTQQALMATAEIGNLLGDRSTAARYRRLGEQLKQRINQRFWLEQDSSYGDFYGNREDAVRTAEGAAKQIALPGPDKLSDRDRQLIRHYQQLRDTWASAPDTTRAWITNQNWPVITPLETKIAPPDRALVVLDHLRRNGVGEYGPYLAARDRSAMMTISTGVAAVAEANYGRTEQSLWYIDKIVQTLNRKLSGSISEMMPDYGCFVIAWTMYGIALPVVQHIFGLEPDAVHKTVVFNPHLPKGWEAMSLRDLPVGSNHISLARAKTGQGIEYTIDASENGWSFVLKGSELSGSRYFLNDKPVSPGEDGIRMTGRKNRILIVP